MNLVKTFDATGVAPNGKLYAGDLNAIQAAAAAQADFAQTIDLGTLRIGEAGLTLSRIGSLEAQLAGDLRVTKILRGLEGLFAGTFTTTQRDAIAAGRRPYGLIIMNSTTNQLEQNKGTDAVPNWLPIAAGIGPDSITATEIAANAVGSSELADNAVDTNAIQSLAVTNGKLAANAVTPAKADLAQTWDFSAAGALRAQGLRVHRHPYASDRHIESGSLSAGALPNDSNVNIGAVTFTDAYAATPRVSTGFATANEGADSVYYTGLSTTGFTVRARNQNNGNTITVTWMSEGQD